MPVYNDEKRNTWFVKFQYKNWEGERKWITKRGFSTKREAKQWEREFEFTQMERSDVQDLSCRPVLAAAALDVAKYDVAFVGVPIWWGREPSIVDTFIEAYDFAGKCMIPFCTSGGSGIEAAVKRIRELTGAAVGEGKRLGGTISEEDLKTSHYERRGQHQTRNREEQDHFHIM